MDRLAASDLEDSFAAHATIPGTNLKGRYLPGALRPKFMNVRAFARFSVFRTRNWGMRLASDQNRRLGLFEDVYLLEGDTRHAAAQRRLQPICTEASYRIHLTVHADRIPPSVIVRLAARFFRTFRANACLELSDAWFQGISVHPEPDSMSWDLQPRLTTQE